MSTEQADTSRAAVKTYVPAYQKEIWAEHADRLDMTQSEFIRTMVQAGRRDFSLDGDGNATTGGPEGSSTAMTERVLDVLTDDEFLSWDELLARVTEDIEAQLESAIEELQDRNRIRYSGKNGGYTVTE